MIRKISREEKNPTKLYSLQTTDSDLRGQGRQPFFLGDSPEVVIITETTTLMAHLVDFSCDGARLASPLFDETYVDSNIEIYCLGSERPIEAVVVNFSTTRFSGELMDQVGVKFIVQSSQVLRTKRFPSPKQFETLCYGPHPFKYNQTVYYQVVDFSAQGMTISTSNNTDLLLPGIRAYLNLVIPNHGIEQVEVEVTHLTQHQANQYHIGCYFHKPSTKMLLGISSYLLAEHEEPASLTELRDNAFLVSSDLTTVARCRYPSSKADSHKYLSLRLKAQQREGRWLGEADIYKTLDCFDNKARHLMITIGDRVVGIARLVFNDGDSDKSEHYSLAPIPQLLREQGFIEASRFATDPEYRSSNVFPLLMKHGFKVCINSDSAWVLANCEDSLVKIYKKIGAINLGFKFKTEFMGDKNLNLMAFDVFSLCQGKGIGFLSWYYIFSDLLPLAESKGRLKLNPFRRFYLHVMKFLAKIIFYYRESYLIKKQLRKRASVLDRELDSTAELQK